MSFKRFLLPVNDKDDIALVADFAFKLADLHSAEVLGIFPQEDVNQNYWLNNFGLSESEIEEAEFQFIRNAAEASRKAEKRFLAYAQNHETVGAHYISASGEIDATLIDHAFCSDAIVLGNTTHHGSPYWRQLADTLLVQSTRPMIICPSRPVPETFGDRVVIAWKQGPEASRSIAAAMPLIESAKDVLILSLGEKEEPDATKRIEGYIALHNANVEVKMLPAKSESIGSLLVKTTAEQPGSILVMGAFSHARWKERTFGGVTEYILRNTDVPVLMMH